MDGDPTGTAMEPTGGRPIVYWFRIARVPVGGAPLAIRERWLGVVLPVRRPRPIEGPEHHLGRDVVDRRIVRAVADGVPVEPDDAMTALRFFGQEDAARWWEDLLHQRPLTSALLFRRAEGDLLPPSLAHLLHPELDDLEETLSA